MPLFLFCDSYHGCTFSSERIPAAGPGGRAGVSSRSSRRRRHTYPGRPVLRLDWSSALVQWSSICYTPVYIPLFPSSNITSFLPQGQIGWQRWMLGKEVHMLATTTGPTNRYGGVDGYYYLYFTMTRHSNSFVKLQTVLIHICRFRWEWSLRRALGPRRQPSLLVTKWNFLKLKWSSEVRRYTDCAIYHKVHKLCQHWIWENLFEINCHSVLLNFSIVEPSILPQNWS